MMNKGRHVVIHPLIFTAYPVLALLAYNVRDVELSAGWRALVFSIFGVAIFLLLLKLTFRVWQKAALICTLNTLLFFSYGHVNIILSQEKLWGGIFSNIKFQLTLWIVILCIGVWWIIVKVRESSLNNITHILNLIAIITIAIPIIQITSFKITNKTFKFEEKPQNIYPIPNNLNVSSNLLLHDIYYIILDAYARDDILTEYFEYDNTKYLDDLKKLGFYIAECSQGNYSQTKLSIATSLNFNYIEKIYDGALSGSKDRSDLYKLIRRNTVSKKLKELGYKIVAFDSGFITTQIKNADIYYSLDPKTEKYGDIINNFEAILLRTTALTVFMDTLNFEKRGRLLFSLEKLETMPLIPGPKLVFAHLLIPHRPYVFGPNGEPVILEGEPKGDYLNQLIYTNKRMLPLLQKIIAESEPSPIIIIQADHGPDLPQDIMKARMPILNAYYLPADGDQWLYPSISPVNSFRVIFNHFFGTHYDLLDDNSFFSPYEDPYTFTIVPDTRTECVDHK